MFLFSKTLSSPFICTEYKCICTIFDFSYQILWHNRLLFVEHITLFIGRLRILQYRTLLNTWLLTYTLVVYCNSCGQGYFKCAGHSISYKIVCASSDDSDQPARSYSLISLRILAVWSEYSQGTLWLSKDLKRLRADKENSDQPTWTRRLIWVFARRTYYIVEMMCPGSINS